MDHGALTDHNTHMPPRRIIMRAMLPLAIVFLANEVIFRFTSIYITFRSFDLITHTLGGLVIAHAVWLLLSKDVRYIYLTLIGSAALAGILWELYEFTHDVFVGSTFQMSQGDTMGDLLFDCIGAGIFIVILIIQRKRENQSQ